MRQWWFLLFWLGAALGARAQAWQRDPVLSNLRLTWLEPDSAGFMWAATDRGLFRYDGYQAVPFNDLIQEGWHLPAGYITTLEFAGGYLWIGAESGLYAYAAGRLHPVLLRATTGGQQVSAICRHAQTGQLWVAYGNSASAVAVFDPKKLGKEVTYAPEVGRGFVNELLDAPGGGMWAVRSGLHETWRLDARAIVQERIKSNGFNWAREGRNGAVYQFSPTKYLAVPGTNGRWQASPFGLFEAQPNGQFRTEQEWLPADKRAMGRGFGVTQVDSTWYWWCSAQDAPTDGFNRCYSLVELTWNARGQRPRVVRKPMPTLPFAGAYRLQVGATGSRLLWAWTMGQQGCYRRAGAASGAGCADEHARYHATPGWAVAGRVLLGNICAGRRFAYRAAAACYYG
jgi:hypothetical protein